MTLKFPYTAQFESAVPVSDSYLILRIQRPQGFDFKAGQHVTLRLHDQIKNFDRTYSIASPPSLKTHLEFCIQLQEESQDIDFMTQLTEMASLKMTAPLGKFQIVDPRKTLVFIAGGSGISPLRSMILDLLKGPDPTSRIHLLYGCKNSEAIPFLAEFSRLSQREGAPHDFHPLFFAETLAPPLTHVLAPVIEGIVTEGFTRVPNLLAQQNHFYLCGPPPLLKALEKLLENSSIKPDQIHFER